MKITFRLATLTLSLLVAFVLAEAGLRLAAGHLSLLGAVGIKTLRVGRQPRVGILATGSELREAGQKLEHSQIYESNRIALAALAKKMGSVKIRILSFQYIAQL